MLHFLTCANVPSIEEDEARKEFVLVTVARCRQNWSASLVLIRFVIFSYLYYFYNSRSEIIIILSQDLMAIKILSIEYIDSG